MNKLDSFINIELKHPKCSELTVKEISKKTAQKIIAEYHYLGKTGFMYRTAYGLFYKDIIVGTIVFHGLSAPETMIGAFGLKRTDKQNGFFELGRLVLIPEYNGKNYGSYFISHAIKQLRKKEKYEIKAIISYADETYHLGTIYQACSFIYCGLTAKKKDFYIYGVKQSRGKTKGIEGGEWKLRPRKHRYIKIFDKKLLKQLIWEIQEYPKHGELE